MSRGALAVCSVAAACFAVCQLAFIHSTPGIYMDELFHIKQTQQYCSGEFGEALFGRTVLL
jgi:DIE2/ALG10 family